MNAKQADRRHGSFSFRFVVRIRGWGVAGAMAGIYHQDESTRETQQKTGDENRARAPISVNAGSRDAKKTQHCANSDDYTGDEPGDNCCPGG